MIKCLFNMLIAYILSPFIPMKKEIWLIGGNKGEMYADNGRAMHEYLLTKDNIEVYWVLDKNAKFRKEFDEKNIRYLIRGFNMLIAYILSPFIPMKKEIWLIGGNKGEMYADNGRAMHEYLLTKDNIEVYWVLDKNAKFRKEFDEKNIRYLIRGSIKSYIYFMKSKVALFSHSISADIVPYLCAVPLISYYHRKCFKVFLNHGTVGLKKRSPMHKRLKKQIDKLLKSYNLNPCDSEFEKSIKVNDWKMPEDTMYVCGYPRYDKLYNRKDTVSTHDILYMPTWRKYDDDGVNEFLNNSKLHEYLKKD